MQERWSGADRETEFRIEGRVETGGPCWTDRTDGSGPHRGDEASSREGTMSRESSRDDLASIGQQ